MAFIPASNVLMLEVRGTVNGQEIENTLYFKSAGAIVASDVEDLFDFFEDTWIPDLMSALSDQYSIDELYATDLTSSTSPTFSRSIVPPIEGTHTGDVLPNNVAAVVSFRTGGRGRSTRGRNYVGGLGEDIVTGDLLDLVTIGDIVAAYETLMGGGSFPVAWVWGVLSRYFANSPRVSGLFQEILDVLATDLTVDSQRGRLH